MILKYGNYAHALNEAGVRISRKSVRGPNQIAYLIEETWDIDGLLFGDDVAEVTDAIEELVEAYSVDGRNLILYDSNGTTRTAHAMISKESVSGTRVTMPPSFPDNGRQNAEYTTFRTYNIQVQASFPDLNGGGLLNFNETVSTQGTGAPRWAYLLPLNGAPIKQQLTQQTTVRVTQSGFALGGFGYPNISPPLFPRDEHADQRNISRETPRPLGDGAVEYKVQWSYQFERG